MKTFCLLLLLCSLSFCTNETNVEPDTEDTTAHHNNTTTAPTDSKPAGIAGCYMRVRGRDTLAADLQQTGNTITGKLTYDNYQKDGSTGSVIGVVEGDIVKLTYSFQSEGMNSVMDVYYKVSGSDLVPATGTMDMRGDTTYFTDPASLQYNNEDRLLKVGCNMLTPKYRSQ